MYPQFNYTDCKQTYKKFCLQFSIIDRSSYASAATFRLDGRGLVLGRGENYLAYFHWNENEANEITILSVYQYVCPSVCLFGYLPNNFSTSVEYCAMSYLSKLFNFLYLNFVCSP
jgi:hypothetical protein